MPTIECENPECAERGVPKTVDPENVELVELARSGAVSCGACGATIDAATFNG